jgi:hypothetical protein
MARLYKHGELREHRGGDGKYVKADPCDGCGKPTNEATRMTDDEVCGGSDGPGFFICDRKRCSAKLEPMTVEQRREHYTKQREINRSK